MDARLPNESEDDGWGSGLRKSRRLWLLKHFCTCRNCRNCPHVWIILALHHHFFFVVQFLPSSDRAPSEMFFLLHNSRLVTSLRHIAFIMDIQAKPIKAYKSLLIYFRATTTSELDITYRQLELKAVLRWLPHGMCCSLSENVGAAKVESSTRNTRKSFMGRILRKSHSKWGSAFIAP